MLIRCNKFLAFSWQNNKQTLKKSNGGNLPELWETKVLRQ